MADELEDVNDLAGPTSVEVELAPGLSLIAHGTDAAVAGRAKPTLIAVHTALNAYAAQVEAALQPLRIVVAEDLHQAIREIGEQPSFTGERLGGTVVGKTIRDSPDWSSATVYLPAQFWPEEIGEQITPFAVVIVAHEFAHALMGAIRGGEPSSSECDEHDFALAARVIAQEAFDEIVVDLLASDVLGLLASVTTTDGETRPATAADVMQFDRVEDVRTILDDVVHPGWPELVRSYQVREIDLGTLYESLLRQTEQVFKALAHAHDEAKLADQPRPDEVLADHRGMKLYIGPAWNALLDAVQDLPLIGTREQVREADDALAAAARRVIQSMWKTLGVTARATPDGMWLDVTDPKR